MKFNAIGILLYLIATACTILLIILYPIIYISTWMIKKRFRSELEEYELEEYEEEYD